MGRQDGNDKTMPKISRSSSSSGIGSMWSSLIFGWYTPVLVHIQSKVDMGESPSLEEDEVMPPLLKEECAAQVTHLFETVWDQEVIDNAKDPSLLKCLWKAFSPPFVVSCMLQILSSGLAFAAPLVLQMMIPFLQDSSLPLMYGICLTVSLFLAQMMTSLSSSHSKYTNIRCSSRIRTALMIAIFQKSLKIDSTYYDDHPIGQVTNLMSVDTNQISFLVEYLPMVLVTPFTIIIAVVMLWNLLGPSCLGGIFTILISIPISTKVAKWMKQFMVKLMKLKDDRINNNQEILSNMKTVKYQAWEEPLRKETEDYRNAEIKQLLRYKIANAATSVLYIGTPIMVSLSSFGLYVTVAGHTLDTTTALTALVLFELIKMPLLMIPLFLNLGIECSVALERIRNFLMAPNFERPKRLTNEGDSTSSNDDRAIIDIKGATFSYQRITHKKKQSTQLNQLDKSEQEVLLVKDNAQYGSTDLNSEQFEKTLTLRNINFQCYAGEFVAIVGEVGSGKTSLLKAILGEMQKVSGELRVEGSVAYFGQDPFIMNDTVKGNILFGKSNEKVDDDLYRLAVRSACLEHDFEMLSDGDQTEIGEKGINVSGGQKARFAIGRAVYRDADISLLDDCLSAVDAHVGRDLFDKCIIDVLLNKNDRKDPKRKKTVILVTNALQYLSHVMLDRIVVLKDGLVVESGSYKELVSREDSHFKSYLDSFNGSMANENRSEVVEEGEDIIEEALEDIFDDFSQPEYIDERRRSSILSASSCRRKSLQKSSRDSGTLKQPVKLMTNEMQEREVGKVSFGVYLYWLRAAGGIWTVVPLILLFVVPEAVNYFSRLWITDFWAPDADGKSQLYYLGIFAVINFILLVMAISKSIIPVVFALRASVKLFSDMMESLLAAPLSFYDTTPTGRIMNRLSKDINTVDETLMTSFLQLMGSVMNILTTIFLVLIKSPKIVFVLPFLFIFYKQKYDYFSQSNRELQRIDSASKSPTYSLFGEALNGFCTIRAFGAEQALLHRVNNFIDKQQHANYLLKTGKSWLSVRLDFVGSILVFFGSLAFVMQKQSISEDELESFADSRGLVLTYLFSVPMSLLYAVRFLSDFEASMVSVERIRQYTQLDREAPYDTPADKLMEKGWPSRGMIEFIGAKLRYRPGLPLVLKGLSIKIPSQSRVGIVGRTGAGKSTIVNAVTRLNELDDGKIILDGVDIKTIGLTTLRSNIAVIPQDPVLFSGTVKTNLDPFNQHSNDKLMDVLGRVGLYSTDSSCAIKSLDDGVEQDGKNYSSGQRQLLVIARALLEDASVVICDEATSSIDAEADARIQRIFRTDFASSTTLTIAHRLNTILDSTHILVMSDGRAVEFDTPSALIAKGGLFKDLVNTWEEEHK